MYPSQDHVFILQRLPLFGTIVVIRSDGTDGRLFPMVMNRCIIGQHADCDIRIQLEGVADQHCLLFVDYEGQVYLRNLCPRNPTLFNWTMIPEKPVKLYHKESFSIHGRCFRWEYPPHSKLRYVHRQEDLDPVTVESLNQERNVALLGSCEQPEKNSNEKSVRKVNKSVSGLTKPCPKSVKKLLQAKMALKNAIKAGRAKKPKEGLNEFLILRNCYNNVVKQQDLNKMKRRSAKINSRDSAMKPVDIDVNKKIVRKPKVNAVNNTRAKSVMPVRKTKKCSSKVNSGFKDNERVQEQYTVRKKGNTSRRKVRKDKDGTFATSRGINLKGLQNSYGHLQNSSKRTKRKITNKTTRDLKFKEDANGEWIKMSMTDSVDATKRKKKKPSQHGKVEHLLTVNSVSCDRKRKELGSVAENVNNCGALTASKSTHRNATRNKVADTSSMTGKNLQVHNHSSLNNKGEMKENFTENNSPAKTIVSTIKSGVDIRPKKNLSKYTNQVNGKIFSEGEKEHWSAGDGCFMHSGLSSSEPNVLSDLMQKSVTRKEDGMCDGKLSSMRKSYCQETTSNSCDRKSSSVTVTKSGEIKKVRRMKPEKIKTVSEAASHTMHNTSSERQKERRRKTVILLQKSDLKSKSNMYKTKRQPHKSCTSKREKLQNSRSINLSTSPIPLPPLRLPIADMSNSMTKRAALTLIQTVRKNMRGRTEQPYFWNTNLLSWNSLPLNCYNRPKKFVGNWSNEMRKILIAAYPCEGTDKDHVYGNDTTRSGRKIQQSLTNRKKKQNVLAKKCLKSVEQDSKKGESKMVANTTSVTKKRVSPSANRKVEISELILKKKTSEDRKYKSTIKTESFQGSSVKPHSKAAKSTNLKKEQKQAGKSKNKSKISDRNPLEDANGNRRKSGTASKLAVKNKGHNLKRKRLTEGVDSEFLLPGIKMSREENASYHKTNKRRALSSNGKIVYRSSFGRLIVRFPWAKYDS